MGLIEALRALRSTPDYARCIATWRQIPPRPAAYADLPAGIAPEVRCGLARQGIERLYTHQAAAIGLSLAGQHVVVVTPTASGKTLCYNVPVLNGILDDPSARALYLFPTKALAQDQLHELDELIRAMEAKVKVQTYDGDTPSAQRQAIRRDSHIIISNPDMLHTGILPHHTRWASFFQNLRHVVVDEVHAYRGIFGSHLANVLRRLRRICRFYGSAPRFVLCSATVANAGALAERLLEAPVAVVDENGAPSGAKQMIFYSPLLISPELGIRRSAITDARHLASEFVRQGVQTIVFARSRLAAEILVRYLQDDLRASHQDEALVRGYRGGYLAGQRREIERGLREGQVRAVVATNALELGIDIGRLDACIMTGYPGTIASTWQQAGRAGRRQDLSTAILVASASPLDQYLVTHPDYFFGRSPERVLINPNNLIILVNHLRCAAFELPFQANEAYGSLSAEQTQQILDYLSGQGELHQVGQTWHWMSAAYPAQGISLRTAEADGFVIMDADSGNRVIGMMDLATAPMLIHEGAIYLHEGASYIVDKLDWEGRTAWVRPSDAEYYTQANCTVDVQVLDVLAEQPQPHGRIAHGEVSVTTLATTYRKVRFYTSEVLGYGDIHLPEQEMHTTAFWFELDEEVAREVESPDRGPNWPEQRRRARQRDHYACQVCGATELSLGREHDVHHIRAFREFGYVPGENDHYLAANQIDNLVTLCRTCHSKVAGDRFSRDALANGLRGLAHLLHHLAPLYLMCEPHNLGVFSELRSPLNGRPAIYLYDQVPAGVGFSEALYELYGELLARAEELVSSCPCADGCPSCVGPATAEGAGGKQATLVLLRRLMGREERNE